MISTHDEPTAEKKHPAFSAFVCCRNAPCPGVAGYRLLLSPLARAHFPGDIQSHQIHPSQGTLRLYRQRYPAASSAGLHSFGKPGREETDQVRLQVEVVDV